MDKFDGSNSPEYWDKLWSSPKRHTEKYAMRKAWDWIRKTDARSVLDVGCGNGQLLNGIKDGRYVMGVDISPVAIFKMHQNYGIKGMAISVYDLDLISGKFDFVVCNHTLEHLARDRDAVVKMKERLNKDGTFFCAVPNNMSSPKETAEHLQMYDSQSLSDLLESVFGNCIIEIIGHHLCGICKNENS